MKHNKYRKLGKNGAEVAPIGIGAMSFTNFYGPCNDEQADKVLTAALDLNLKHIDTSNIYGMGKSEERIGEFLSKQGKKKVAEGFKVGQKVTYLGHPGEITKVNKEMTGATTYNVSYDKGTGKTKASNILSTDGTVTEAKDNLYLQLHNLHFDKL